MKADITIGTDDAMHLKKFASKNEDLSGMGLQQYDAGIGTIYWHTDNIKLQQVIQEFLENKLPNKLRSA